MNRLEFIGQTYQGKPVSIDDIINFFDHTMAAYELIGSMQPLHIDGNIDNTYPSLRLQIESPNQSELQKVVNYINNIMNNHTNIYGKYFIIEASIQGNSVDLFVREDYNKSSY